MDAKTHVEILRLHAEHLRSLVDQVTANLTALEQALTALDKPTYADAVHHMDGLGKLSQLVVQEMTVFQARVQELESKDGTPSGA